MPLIRRVILPREKISTLLDQQVQGILRELPRKEFEEKVARARSGLEARNHSPSLAEARYRAHLDDTALIGTGQWKVANSGSGTGYLPLQPLNLALRQPRFENRDALIADFDGKTSSLLLDTPGNHAVAIEWSARAEERAEGLHFDLKFPVSPVAVLELDLPADRSAAAVDGNLVSGPHPAETPDRRLWRITCGGKPGVDLWIRSAGASAPSTLLLSRQITTQTLDPEGLKATYQFDLDVLHREVTDLHLEFDPDLRPFEVVLPGLNDWNVLPPAKPDGRASLAIHLREPLRPGHVALLVNCLAPVGSLLSPDSASPLGFAATPALEWQSPGMRLLEAVPRGETLVILVHPDLRLDDLKPGDFRLTGSTAEPASERRGVIQRLSSAGGAITGADGTQRRPAARLQPHAVEYRARQLAWWQPSGDPASVTLQIACEVERGRLFQVPILLPVGWDVERVEMAPAGQLRNWTVRPALPESLPADTPGGTEGRFVLLVDLQRPLLPSSGDRPGSVVPDVSLFLGRPRVPSLSIRLLAKAARHGLGEVIPFPTAIPLGARFHEGVLAISYDAQTYQATLRATSPESESEDEGPWGIQLPDASYSYHGRAVEGTLVLRPRPPQVRARCVSDVYLRAGRAAVDTRLILEAESGRPDTVDLSFSAPLSLAAAQPRAVDDRGHSGSEWRAEPAENSAESPVKSFERLHSAEAAEGLSALGCGSPFAAAALLAARPPGERWRLTLTKPLRPRAPIVLHSARRLDPSDRSWKVPLPAVTGARRMDGEVTLHLAGAEFVQVETAGLQEAPPAAPVAGRSRIGTPWRTFRYGDGSVSLVFRGRGSLVDRATEAVADHARLTTYLQEDGSARHRFSFRVSNWSQGPLPIRLPPGARPISARIAGHPVALSSLAGEPGGLVLPVPAFGTNGLNDGPLRFEIDYETDAPPATWWKTLATIEAPAPVLPVPSLTFHRAWRLPPGFEPIPDGRQRRVPGAGGASVDGLPRSLTEQFIVETPLPAMLAPHPAAEGQAEGLAAAAIGLRPKSGGRVVRLRELVAELSSEFLSGRLVVDDAALRATGIGAEAQLGLVPPQGPEDRTPPWEALGLTVIAAGPASLLTSDARVKQWRAFGEPPDLVRSAVADALTNGHDPSGHFRTAPDWIRHASENGREGSSDTPPDLSASLAPWTEWEPNAGVGDDSTLTIVRRDRVLAAAVLLAALAVPGLWICRRRDLFLTAYVGAAALAYLWLPGALQPLAWLPLLAGGGAALSGYLVLAARRSRSVRQSVPGPASALVTATAVLAIISASLSSGSAEEPSAQLVYIVPDSSGSAGKESVLVAPELLERLDALARAGSASAVPVLYAMSLEGKVNESIASFESVFEVYSPVEGPTDLSLPLDGIYLDGDLLVDGARALPVSLPGPQAGFSVPLHGAGRHKVEIRFRVPVKADGETRSLRFTVPRTAQSQLNLTLPAGSSAPQAVTKHGLQRVTADSNGEVLHAELGRITVPLEVRWTQNAHPGSVEAREAYLWELNADSATLTGWLDYKVSGGVVTSLSIDLPPGLEIQAAEARRVGKGDTVRVRAWQVSGAGANRVLELGLAAPAEREFQIGLTLVPSTPLPSEVTLPLPAPRAKVSLDRSHLAYRARGLKVAVDSTRWLTGGSADAFAPFWPEASRPNLRPGRNDISTYAATFRRESGQTPVLRLHLSAAPPVVRAQRQDLSVRVLAHHAEVQTNFRVAAPDASPATLSCRLQPANLTVSAVRGEGVRRWTQSGDRLVIWPESGPAGEQRKAFSLEISAWLPFDAEGNRFEIPSVQLEGASQAAPASIRLIPEAGLSLLPSGLKGLRSASAPESELAFVAERADYSGNCEVRTGATGTTVRILTVAEVRERRLGFRSIVEFSVRRGDLRAATVRLRNWDGEDVKLEVDKAIPVRQPGPRRTASDRTWALEFRPGVTGSLRLTLSGSVSLEDAAAGIPMPDVTVPGSGPGEVLVSVVGPELATDVADGLSAVEAPAIALKNWPNEADRLRISGGQVWKVARDEWTLRLRPRSGAGAGPVRVLLADSTAALADGRHWLHEAVYWVRHGPNTDLNLLLPQPGTVVAVSVDGGDVAPLQPEPRRVWVPLPGRAGARAVRLRWRYDEKAESLDNPILQIPTIEGAIDGPAVWTVYVPAGFEMHVKSPNAPRPGPGRAATVALYRAEAQLRLSEALAEAAREGVTAPLAVAQQRFYAFCRQADQALQLIGEEATELAPAGMSLSRWQRSLLDDNRKLARDRDFDEARSEAERRSDTSGAAPRTIPESDEPAMLSGLAPPRIRGPLPDAGTPVYSGSAESAAAPSIAIRPLEVTSSLRALADSVILLLIVACAAAVALLPGLRIRVAAFWPEPLLLFGLLLWYRTGLTAVAALFLLLGASGRLLTLTDAVRAFARSWRAARLAAAGRSSAS
jgi:hypothetical protein